MNATNLASSESPSGTPSRPQAQPARSPEGAVIPPERGSRRARGQARPLFDGPIVRRAMVDSFRKLDPRHQVRNPVMFVVEVGSILTTVLFVQALVGKGEAPARFILAVSALALVHRALRELRRGDGGGARQGAGGLAPERAPGHPRQDASPSRDAARWPPPRLASALRKGDLVLVEAGDVDPRATARSSRASRRSTRAPSPARARRSSARAAAIAAP